MASSSSASGPGRPKDATIDDRVANAVLKVLQDKGFQALTVSAVATAADVSKPAIYARWPDRTAMVVSALERSAPPLRRSSAADPAEQVVELVTDFLVTFSRWAGGRTVLALHATVADDPDVVKQLLERYWAPRAAIFESTVEAAKDAGVLDRNIEPDVIRDLLFGPSIYRWLVTGKLVTRGAARTAVDIALRGLMPASA